MRSRSRCMRVVAVEEEIANHRPTRPSCHTVADESGFSLEDFLELLRTVGSDGYHSCKAWTKKNG
jgi:hypothetical protein